MTKKHISRKEFLIRAGAGFAALGLSGQIIKGKQNKSGKFNKLRELGRTGIFVSPLCFGASRTTDEALIRYALDRNINFIDTGRSYARGNNEKLVGRVIKGSREEIIVQSKIKLETEELAHKGKGRKGAVEIKDILSRRIEESLKALETDYIDIMLYHSADNEALTFHDAVLKFYDNIKTEGIIRAHGFSSHDYELKLLKRNISENFYDVIMHPFNFSGSFTHSLSAWSASWDQELLFKLLSESHKKGTGIVAMKTCSAGKYSPGKNRAASYRNSVDWALKHEFIDSAAVAMASYDQVNEHTAKPEYF